MSKFSKICIVLLTVCVALGLVLGITYSVKTTEDLNQKNTSYAIMLDDLEKELNINIENVQELEYQIELKGLTIEDLTRTIVVKEREIVTLNNEVQEKEVQIVEKNNTIVEKQQEIVTLTNTVNEKETEIQDKEAEIVEKTNTIVEYQERIVYLEQEDEDNTAEIESLNAQIEGLEAQVSTLQSELAAERQTVTSLRATLAEKESTITSLQEQIATLESEKSEVQTQIVEKERIITEKEEILVETQQEVATLQVNVNVLNQTIIELNVQIELLQEALENDTSTFLFSMLVGDNRQILLKNGDILISSDDFGGIYIIDHETYECKTIIENGKGWHTLVELNDGNIIFAGEYTRTDYLPTYYYNISTEELYKISDNCLYYVVPIGEHDAIMRGGVSWLKDLTLFNGVTHETTVLLEENNYVYYDIACVMPNGDCIFQGYSNGGYVFHYYNYSNNEVTPIENLDSVQNVGSIGYVENYFVIYPYRYNNDTTVIYMIDTTDVSVHEINVNSGDCGQLMEIEGKYFFSATVSGTCNIYELDLETLTITSRFTTIGRDWKVFDRLSNGNYLLTADGYSESGIIMYDVENDSFIQLYNQYSNWKYFYEVDENTILFASEFAPNQTYTNGVLLIKLGETISTSMNYYNGYVDTFTRTDEGIRITSSKNPYQNDFFYSFSTGEVRESFE